MSLLQTLGVASVDDIDPERALTVGPLTVGPEAAREAIVLLSANAPPAPIQLVDARVTNGAFYWSLARNGQTGEIIGLPALARPIHQERALRRSQG